MKLHLANIFSRQRENFVDLLDCVASRDGPLLKHYQSNIPNVHYTCNWIDFWSDWCHSRNFRKSISGFSSDVMNVLCVRCFLGTYTAFAEALVSTKFPDEKLIVHFMSFGAAHLIAFRTSKIRRMSHGSVGKCHRSPLPMKHRNLNFLMISHIVVDICYNECSYFWYPTNDAIIGHIFTLDESDKLNPSMKKSRKTSSHSFKNV